MTLSSFSSEERSHPCAACLSTVEVTQGLQAAVSATAPVTSWRFSSASPQNFYSKYFPRNTSTSIHHRKTLQSPTGISSCSTGASSPLPCQKEEDPEKVPMTRALTRTVGNSFTYLTYKKTFSRKTYIPSHLWILYLGRGRAHSCEE